MSMWYLDLNGSGIEILKKPPSPLEFARLVHISRPVIIKGNSVFLHYHPRASLNNFTADRIWFPCVDSLARSLSHSENGGEANISRRDSEWVNHHIKLQLVSNNFAQAMQMQLLVDQTVDFISSSPVSKKWPCRSFLQNSVRIKIVINFDGSHIRSLWQAFLMIRAPKFAISSLRMGTYIQQIPSMVFWMILTSRNLNH